MKEYQMLRLPPLSLSPGVLFLQLSNEGKNSRKTGTNGGVSSCSITKQLKFNSGW